MRNRIFPCGGWIATLRAAILGGPSWPWPRLARRPIFPSARSRSSCPMPRAARPTWWPACWAKLAAKFGQPVLVENRPGASEQIASAYVAKSTADGYTIMLATMAGLAVNPWLYQLPYDVLHDFAPIVTAVKMPSFIVVNPQTPVKSVPQLTDYLRNNRVSYATAGTGTPSHLAMEMYKKYAKVDAESVQYKGGAPALQDVMAGHVPVMVALAPEALPYIKGQAQGPGRDQRRAVSLPSRRARGHRIPRPQGLRDRSMAGLRGAGGHARRRRQHAQPGHQ